MGLIYNLSHRIAGLGPSLYREIDKGIKLRDCVGLTDIANRVLQVADRP